MGSSVSSSMSSMGKSMTWSSKKKSGEGGGGAAEEEEAGAPGREKKPTDNALRIEDKSSDEEDGSGGAKAAKKSTKISLPSMMKSKAPPTTPSNAVYAAVGRQRPMKSGAVTVCEAYTADVPVIAVELGRKCLTRKAPPGWDDVHCEGWRAVKLPVHDMTGATSYCIVFGGDFDPKRAQAIVERFALMLGPMVSGQLLDGEASRAEMDGNGDAAARGTGTNLDDPAEVLELHKTMEPMIMRELEHANSAKKIDILQDQMSEVRRIMETNVELILDRQEQLQEIDEKASELQKVRQTEGM